MDVPYPAQPIAERGRGDARRRVRVVDLVRTYPDLAIAGGVFLFALIPRLLYVAWAPVFIGGDSLQYYQPVYDLMHGRGFTLSLKRPPAYPALILAIQSVFGTSFVPIIVAQHLMGAVVAALTYGLGQLTFGRWVGLAAAALTAINGGLMRWEHFLMSEALFTFSYILAVFLLVLGLRVNSLWPWVGAGLALGLAMLSRSAGQVLLLAIPPALLLTAHAWPPAPRRLLPPIKKMAVVFGVCSLVTVPWMFRNYVVHKAFTTAGAAGQNLITFTAIIHRPDFSFEDPLVREVDSDRKKAEARKIVQKAMEDKLAKPERDVTGLGIHNRIMEETKVSQAQADNTMREIALRAIASRPEAYARNVGENVVEIFLGYEENLRTHGWDLWESRGWRGPMRQFVGPATPEQEANYGRLATLDGLYHPARLGLPLAILFVIGTAAALAVPTWRPTLVIAFAALSLILVSAATVGAVPRYRLPPDPLINVVAFGGVAGLILLVRRRSGRSRRPIVDQAPSSTS